ncbi:DUF2975 domain-containing protein [Mucilaginibacter sp. UR6-11]|uniref:DUF2975 domain-containing protein n=1 Tax=Mucilaginibacter sp. UR6-11 TaxID=1435644 RepID=UPI001E391C37|nr:DUF2975 domain-containing protein [Mucilaginibacter sp. UR6-11]MCC8426257.1 DUF2975 domain-containing protein [Mucilaginibacter sp. UR6-11]
MKTNSHWLLKTIKVVLALIWYVNIVLIIIAFSVLTLKFCTSDFTEFSNPVKYNSHLGIIKLPPLTPDAKDIIVTNDQGILKMKLKNTFGNIISAYFFLIALETLVTIIIYQLRKFFASLDDSTPFKYDNISRLKLIALCFALLTPLHILLGIDTAFILHSQVKGFDLFNMVWTESLTGLILGAVIYVMADVFNYGFNLQKENEEFV